MAHTARISGIILMVALALSACGRRDRDPELMNIRSSTQGPDEFAVLPGNPLEAPASYTDLPVPTPGGTNRTDPTPNADAVEALGGRRSSVAEDGRPGTDGSLFSHTSRYGVSANIRNVLAREDLEYRRQNDGRVLERWFNVNVYYRAYRRQALDQYAELLRLRRMGIWTPAAPPEGFVSEE